MCDFCGIINQCTIVDWTSKSPSHCSFTCSGVAVPSAVERKELLQFPVVKEVPSEL